MKRINAEDVLFDTFVYITLLFIFIITLYPFYYIFITSLNEGMDILVNGNIYFWPRRPTLDNYKAFFTDIRLLQGLKISVLRTGIGTFLGVMFTCMIAYGLSLKGLLFKKFYMTLIIICMYFSGGIIPYYVALRTYGLLNNFLIYVIPGMLDLFLTLVAITFFRQIPDELSESARMDGANDFVIFIRLIIPLIAAFSLFFGVGHWNNWFDSAFFVWEKSLRTFSYMLIEVINKSTIVARESDAALSHRVKTPTPITIRMTALMIAVLPIIGIYPFLQKYFIKGVMIGSVKE